jgi:hypothetical protein
MKQVESWLEVNEDNRNLLKEAMEFQDTDSSTPHHLVVLNHSSSLDHEPILGVLA